jgi:hypothetical protein
MIKRNKSRKPKNKSRKSKNKSRKPKKAKGPSHFISVQSFSRRLTNTSRRRKENRRKKARVLKNKRKNLKIKIKKQIKAIQAIQAKLIKEKDKYPAIDDDKIEIGTMMVSKLNIPIDIILEILKQSKELEEEDKKNKKIILDKITKTEKLLFKFNENDDEKNMLNSLLPDISSLNNIDEIINKLETIEKSLQSIDIDLKEINKEIDNIKNILDKLYNLLDSFLLDEHQDEELFQQILSKYEEQEYQQNFD